MFRRNNIHYSSLRHSVQMPISKAPPCSWLLSSARDMDGGKDLESVNPIDLSSEDDLLLASSPCVSKTSGSNVETSCLSFQGSLDVKNTFNSDTSNIEETICPLKFLGKSIVQPDRFPALSDSPETPNIPLGYNLRKSLAWDSAFFTGEGVLNPEELADVNSSFGNIQKQSLAKIPEAVPKSQRTVLQPKKGLLRSPTAGSRIPILPSTRQPSVNTSSTQTKGLRGKTQPAPVRKMPSAANARHALQRSKDACLAKDQRRINRAGKLKSEIISPTGSVESFASESSSSSISLTRRSASSAPVLRTNSLSRIQSTTKDVKPSGLRLPAPKLGYFDANLRNNSRGDGI